MITQSDSVVPQDWQIVNVQLHQHIGGVVMSVEHWRNGVKVSSLCDGKPGACTRREVGGWLRLLRRSVRHDARRGPGACSHGHPCAPLCSTECT